MNYRFEYYTDVGGRTLNEDSYLCLNGSNCNLFAVADGLGGHDRGEIASGIVVDELKKEFLASPKRFNSVDVISKANLRIIQEQRQKGSNMKTTIAMVYIDKDKTTIVHVGDTRIYAFNNAEIVYQSIDHSASQMAVAVGEIPSSKIRFHEDRNVLTRVLGASEELRIDVDVLQNNEYSALLLCSDGFWEYVVENEMCEALLQSVNPSDWLKKMRDILQKRTPSDNDNNTAVCIIVEEGML